MNAIDALAISMLAVLLAAFGVVALLFMSMARNASRRDLELERLMQEATAENDHAPSPAGAKEPRRAAWEREVDWWKSDG